MSARSGQLASGAAGHLVEFYAGDQELAASIAGYLTEGIAAGDMVVVVATQSHRLAFEAGLAASDVDPGAAEAAGGLLMLDAAGTLQGFLHGGRLDRDRFEAALGGLVRRVARAGRPVRIYAEMVALLWDAGQVTLALELEELWNDLGSRLPFSLRCGYPARLLADDASTADMEAVCRLHSNIIGPRPGQREEEKISGAAAEAVRSFPGVLEAARSARHFVTGVLGSRRDQALTQDAAIVAAELAANAVLHAGSGFTVAVAQSAAGVRISVQDATPVQSADGNGALAASPGHGLGVVSAITSRWAVEPLPDGKVVWAELPAAPQPAS